MATKHPLPGSERKVEQGSKLIGACDPSEKIEVFVMLRRQQQAQFDALMKRIEAGDPNVEPLSRETLAKDYGAAPDDIAKVKAFAAAHGLSVVREDPAARSVLLSGTVEQFQNAFGVKLEKYQHHTAGEFRGRTGVVNVPDDLHGVVEAVLGLDNRPQARPHFRIRPPFRSARTHQASFTPLELASLYKFPEGDGGGQCVGI
ncbi:protease pro-enzyme activation domain-containing protein, partial [Paraburkholderia caledonica]